MRRFLSFGRNARMHFLSQRKWKHGACELVVDVHNDKDGLEQLFY